jgi:nucleoside-diphosphate-sugar epimerase
VGQVFIENALNRSKMRVDGDGSEKLDFTYIDDLVDGICLTVQNAAARNQIFNMTYGSSRSIQELVDVVKVHFPGAEIEYVDRDTLMPVRGTLCVDKAVQLLEYQPKFTIEGGFDRYIQWYRNLSYGEYRV